MTKRIALVTGGMGGIGSAICKALAEAGHIVVTTYSKPGREQAWHADMKGLGFNDIHSYQCDVTDFAACQDIAARIAKDIGPISILVNNAGITRDGLLMRMKDEDWDAIMDTNLKSVFKASKAVMRGMMKARSGRIINIASVVGAMGNAGQANYAAAKAGIIGFTKSMAREVGSRNITVNCVAPGFIDTDMTRALPEAQREALVDQISLGRLGDAKDIADAVVFLASDRAAYITGQTLHVNGGMLMP